MSPLYFLLFVGFLGFLQIISADPLPVDVEATREPVEDEATDEPKQPEAKPVFFLDNIFPLDPKKIHVIFDPGMIGPKSFNPPELKTTDDDAEQEEEDKDDLLGQVRTGARPLNLVGPVDTDAVSYYEAQEDRNDEVVASDSDDDEATNNSPQPFVRIPLHPLRPN